MSRVAELLMTRIVIADETPLILAGIRAIIKDSGHLVVGEAADGLRAIQQVEAHKPDLLIVSLTLPFVHGLEVTRQVSVLSARTRVILISHLVEPAEIATAIAQGVRGFIHINSTPDDIRQAVHQVNGGKRYVCQAETHTIAGLLATAASASHGKAHNGDHDSRYDSLTVREREIFQLTAEGLSRPQIAKRLFISERTVETHRAHLMKKLELHSQTDLVRFAIRKGVLAA